MKRLSVSDLIFNPVRSPYFSMEQIIFPENPVANMVGFYKNWQMFVTLDYDKSTNNLYLVYPTFKVINRSILLGKDDLPFSKSQTYEIKNIEYDRNKLIFLSKERFYQKFSEKYF
jgi:hypothetical protein